MGEKISDGTVQMSHEKATPTPRPWAWEWDALNNIAIYQITPGLHSTVVAEVGIEDSESDEQKRTAEADAALIVELVNEQHERLTTAQPMPAIDIALDLAREALKTDGGHHKQWFLEQIIKAAGGHPGDSHELGVAP